MEKTGRVVTPLGGTSAHPLQDGDPIDAPLRLHSCLVAAEWVDYNGHMSESCYLLVVGDNADAFFRYIGIDEAYRATGHSLYTVETHLHHRREVAEGEPLFSTLQVLDHDLKRVHLFHEVLHTGTGDVLATAEQMLVHVDMEAARSAPMPVDVLARLEAIARVHSKLPRPPVVGRPMAIRRKEE